MTVSRLTVLATLAALAGGADAQTLSIRFAPPDMAVTPICIARAPDAELVGFWTAWDGTTLPDRAVGLITRDLRRLAEMDAQKWDPVIRAAISALGKADVKFTDDDRLLAEINQFIATGQLQALKEAGLVQTLLTHADSASARTQFALSGFLTKGVGIAKDPAQGTDLLIAAGYGGSTDALLELSRLSLAGAAPAGWDLSPDLSVTMALGALIGQMDPLICDRIARIARTFTSGEIVTVDHDLALRWYRFAADLGDPLSAWRVVEYQIQSEQVVKDNPLLIAYLRQAADGGLSFARVALGRVLEAGALLPQDLEAARSLYEQAAASGDQAALVRLIGFFEPRLAEDPTLRPAYVAALTQLSALPDAPGWAFAKLAKAALFDKGRWAAEAEALPLWQEAAQRRDPAAIRTLAEKALGQARTDAEFYAALDPLIGLVSSQGEVAPLTDLKEAFMCKAPNAPHLQEAAFWADAEAALGSTSLDFTPKLLAKLSAATDPLTMAAFQTQALSGRATPLANMLSVLNETNAPPSTLAFWTTYAAQFPDVTTALASLVLDRAETPAERARALNLFAQAVAMGEANAGLKLAQALLQDPGQARRSAALDLLKPLADLGHGEAMALLQIADPVGFPDMAAIYSRYGPVIEARGDFTALLLAMPFLPDPAQREMYRARATEVMSCSFFDAIAFAQVWRGLDQPQDARRWLVVAAELAGQDKWRMVVLADAQRTEFGKDGLASAVALYEASMTLGSKTAVQRLLEIYGVKGGQGYDANRAATLYVTLIARSDPASVPNILAALTRQNPALAVMVDTRLDLDDIYLQSAEAGNPAGMREHARRPRATAKTPAKITAATEWLARASNAGDAKAMVLLSQAYSLGVGIPASLELAQMWLQRAADAGENDAADLVQMLENQGVDE